MQFAVIVAGGRGQRMQSDVPKQFLLLKGTPVLMHTISRFHQALPDCVLVIVLPEDQMAYWSGLCEQHKFNIAHQVVAGGDERFFSVKNGLALCGEGVVGIHDGVRPLISVNLIRSCYSKAAECGSAIPVFPVAQSLRLVDGHGSRPVDRTGICTVQTPQCFETNQLRRAYEQPYNNAFTDDATVFEASGGKIHTLLGENWNIKITDQDDLQLAAAVLSIRG